jgi:hypothetical protein
MRRKRRKKTEEEKLKIKESGGDMKTEEQDGCLATNFLYLCNFARHGPHGKQFPFYC